MSGGFPSLHPFSSKKMDDRHIAGSAFITGVLVATNDCVSQVIKKSGRFRDRS
jgi:hypothetical protein